MNALAAAVDSLQRGGVVAFATESSYGLAVDIGNEAALHRLYRLKRRPADKPLPVLSPTADVVSAGLAAAVPQPYQPLLSLFWPGPLTLIFPAHPSVSAVVTGGTGTIGIRRSPHPLAAALVTAFGGAITATSANISGLPPCTSPTAVEEMFADGMEDPGR